MRLKEFLEEAVRAKYVDFDDFVENYPQDIGSAFEIWMHDDQKKKMFELYKQGKTFVSKAFDHDRGDKDKFWTKVDKWKDGLKAKGYKDYTEDENTDATEFIMVK